MATTSESQADAFDWGPTDPGRPHAEEPPSPADRAGSDGEFIWCSSESNPPSERSEQAGEADGSRPDRHDDGDEFVWCSPDATASQSGPSEQADGVTPARTDASGSDAARSVPEPTGTDTPASGTNGVRRVLGAVLLLASLIVAILLRRRDRTTGA